MKSMFCLLVFLVLMTFQVKALRLYVQEPRVSSHSYPGTIEDIQMTVTPHGSYMEVGLFLTISPRGSVFSSETDTLEAILDFELDNNAFINGMWLFIDDTTYVDATLMDKWTAGLIYEGIVSRRLDPSILYKKEAGQYQVKIFPLYGNSSRTVKINLFLPVDWKWDHVSTELPLKIIDASKNCPEKLRIHAYPDNYFILPYFKDNETVRFRENNNLRFGKTQLAELYLDTAYADDFAFCHLNKSGYFSHVYQDEDENFYQYALDLKDLLQIQHNKNIAFLLDFDSRKSNITKSVVFTELRKAIFQNLTPTDSFNIFVSNSPIAKVSDTWMPADSSIIEQVFANLAENMLDDNSHLPELCETGVSWVSANTDSAMIVLIANSDGHGARDTANVIGEKILAAINDNISFTTCTFVEKNWVTNFINTIAYTGNDYLYLALARLTQGNIFKLQTSGGTMEKLLNNCLNSLLGGFENVSLMTHFADGYAYDRILWEPEMSDIRNGITYIELGKFFGKLPMLVDINGYYRFQPFQRRVVIPEEVSSHKYNTRAIWAGKSILDMEAERTSSNWMVYDIINKSLKYNVLSIFTAYLAKDTDTLLYIPPDIDDIPVELLYFDGYVRNNNIELNWATGSEINNCGFYLSRRIPGVVQNWEYIGFINGVGNSKNVNRYNYTDLSAKPNNVYEYQLRQVDFDGTLSPDAHYVTIHFDGDFNLSLQQNEPNPIQNETTIRFSVREGNQVKLDVYDIYGTLVATLVDHYLEPDVYEVIWNAKSGNGNDLSNGIYICKLSCGASSKTIKMIIRR